MPVNAIKATMYINYGEWDWSETHYLAGSDPANQTVVDHARGLAFLRGKLLANYGQITAIRLSSVDVPNKTQPVFLTPPYNNQFQDALGLWYRTDWIGDTGFMAINVQLNTAPGPHRTMMITGIPDLIWNNFQFQMTQPADFQARFADYLDTLKGHNVWGMLGTQADSTPTSQKPVVAIGLVGGFLVNLNVPAHGYVSGQQILVRGIRNKGGPRITGRWKITVVDPNNFTLNGAKGPLPLYGSGGTVRPYIPVFIPYNGGQPTGVTHRKRGSTPFRGPRGRSPKRS